MNNELNMFVTLLIIIFDSKTGEVEYVNGGHCLPLVVDQQTSKLRVLDKLSGPMVGVFDEVEYVSFTDRLNENELLFAITDGVTEAMNEKKELYSDERLEAFLMSNADKEPYKLIDELYRSILKFRGNAEASDDITIFCFNRGKI